MKSHSSHKLRRLGDAGAVVAAASSVADAAKRLGVKRSTVYRWIAAGKTPKPGGERTGLSAGPVKGQTPEVWAAQVRGCRELDATGAALLDLAVSAFTLARENSSALVRLSAMTRFQALVKQLRLDEGEAESGKPAESSAPATTKNPAVRRVTHDPRRLLQAVK